MRAIFSASSPMRSRSVTVLLIAMIMRRSLAAGCRLTMVWLQSPSMVTSYPLTRGSLLMTRSMSSRFPVANPSIAARIWDSTRPPICSTCERRPSRSASNCLERCSLWTIAQPPRASAEAAGDVILGLFHLRLDEQVVGDAELDEFANVHVGSVVRHARGLLHVVGNDQYGHLLLQFVDQFLDARRGNGVQRRGRLVEKQDLGFGCQGARAAPPLPLPAGEVERQLMQPVL